MFAAGVYILVVHGQWSPIWLFCFFWATGFWVVARGIYDEFLEEREQRETSSDVGAASGRLGANGRRTIGRRSGGSTPEKGSAYCARVVKQTVQDAEQLENRCLLS
jgi:hypothetical protein